MLLRSLIELLKVLTNGLNEDRLQELDVRYEVSASSIGYISSTEVVYQSLTPFLQDRRNRSEDVPDRKGTRSAFSQVRIVMHDKDEIV